MLLNTKISALLLALAISFTIISCDLSSDIDEQEVASAVIAAEFTDGDTGEAIPDLSVLVSAAFEGSDNFFEQGTIETDENGEFEAAISSGQETVITSLEFTVVYNDETYTFTEELELEVQFSEPYQRADFNFAIEPEQNPDPE